MTKVAQHSPSVTSRTFDGEAVIIDTEANVVRMLNDVGSRIWNLIDGQRTEAEIAHVLVDEYDVTVEEARQSVVEFLAELEVEELISQASIDSRNDS